MRIWVKQLDEGLHAASATISACIAFRYQFIEGKTEEELKKYNKNYEFHRWDGAGHGFFAVDRPSYRQHAAVEGWEKVLDFYGRHLK